MKEHIPGQLLREHKTQAGDDIYLEVVIRNANQVEILVPAVAEPMLVWVASGSAVVEERPLGGDWPALQVKLGDLSLTRFPLPVDMRWSTMSSEP